MSDRINEKKYPKVEIFTDGGVYPNPGKGSWAALLRFKDQEKMIYGSEAETTNNRMELTAVIQALKTLKFRCEVTITTDSEYVKNAMTKGWLKRWQEKNWTTSTKEPVKNIDLWVELQKQAARHSLEWRWTRGHDGHPENERVDATCSQILKGLPLSDVAIKQKSLGQPLGQPEQ